MNELIERFITGFTEYYSKGRNNSKFYNRMLSQNKFLRIHPVHVPVQKAGSVQIDVLVGFANDDTVIYPEGDDLQHEVFNFMKGEGWHSFFRTGFTEEEMVEFLPETRYIETSQFKPIEVPMPTWADLLNAPKLGDADFDILQETFEEFHGINDNYELTCNLHNLFGYIELKPDELELRIVYDDIDDDHKYGDAVILLFWKGEFLALCNQYINRYRSDPSFYVANENYWREMMAVLYSKADIPAISPIRGAEILDMTQEVDNITNVPGFAEKNYA
jgi:hypothetical protein